MTPPIWLESDPHPLQEVPPIMSRWFIRWVVTLGLCASSTMLVVTFVRHLAEPPSARARTPGQHAKRNEPDAREPDARSIYPATPWKPPLAYAGPGVGPRLAPRPRGRWL
jgi:hypothetical protein